MKVVTTYIAFDDTEFNIVEECMAYENHYIDLMIEAEECYSFCDKNMNKTGFAYWYCHNIEEVLEDFSRAYDDCEYIRVIRKPSNALIGFIRHYFGYVMPEEEGLWEFDFNKWVWKRVES